MILFAEILWQPIIAYALVAIAAAWLVRRVWKIVRRGTIDGQRASSGAGCAGCPQSTPRPDRPKAKPLVQLDSAPKGRDAS